MVEDVLVHCKAQRHECSSVGVLILVVVEDVLVLDNPKMKQIKGVVVLILVVVEDVLVLIWLISLVH